MNNVTRMPSPGVGRLAKSIPCAGSAMTFLLSIASRRPLRGQQGQGAHEFDAAPRGHGVPPGSVSIGSPTGLPVVVFPSPLSGDSPKNRRWQPSFLHAVGGKELIGTEKGRYVSRETAAIFPIVPMDKFEMTARGDESAFCDLQAEWSQIQRDDRQTAWVAWAAALDSMSREEARLRADGRWVRGTADVFGVLGISRAEVRHTKFLAWLMDPAARHGFGSRLLERVLARVYPGERFANLERA